VASQSAEIIPTLSDFIWQTSPTDSSNLTLFLKKNLFEIFNGKVLITYFYGSMSFWILMKNTEILSIVHKINCVGAFWGECLEFWRKIEKLYFLSFFIKIFLFLQLLKISIFLNLKIEWTWKKVIMNGGKILDCSIVFILFCLIIK